MKTAQNRKMIQNKTAEEIELSGLEQSASLALKVVAVITLVNVAALYWFPTQFPLSSFSAVKLMFLAYGNAQYIWILVSVLICALLFAGGMAISKKRIVFPVLSFFYLLYDFIELLFITILDYKAANGYMRSDIAGLLMTTVLGVIVCIYCNVYWKNNLTPGKKMIVQVCFWFIVSSCLMIAAVQGINLLQ